MRESPVLQYNLGFAISDSVINLATSNRLYAGVKTSAVQGKLPELPPAIKAVLPTLPVINVLAGFSLAAARRS